MIDAIEKQAELAKAFIVEDEKALNGNKAAAKRARKITLELGKNGIHYRKQSIEREQAK